ncbi:MAG: lipopolysaccharide heptosyltransferase II [Proteobacteria bacterium]|jgi:heptosyltransferase-2|nr:lipopolysaccharide heptosyltransferase II [Pseudomonadota bacterium]
MININRDTQTYRVLVIAPAWVGDLVMSQTLFKILKKQYGDSLELDVFANSWTKGLLLRMDEVNGVIDNPFAHGKLSLFERIRLGFSLRKFKYDQVIVLPNSLKSAIMPFFAKIKKRTGFVGESRYGLLNDIYKLDKERLPKMIDRFCALINNGEKPKKIDFPHLNTDIQNQYELIEKLNIHTAGARNLGTHAVGIDTVGAHTRKIVAFCPAAEYGISKRWLPDYFAQLADMLIDEGYLILVLGSNKDITIGEKILQNVKTPSGIINLCGKTDLVDTVDVLALCTHVVTNDSGLMHVACAVGVNVIAVYGSSSPDFTPPLSSHAQILRVSLACSPCFERTCRYGHYNCLKLITPDVVYARIINKFAPAS